MRTFLIAFLTLISLTLTGCESAGQLLKNRIAVTIAFDECRLDSRWSRPGITTPIDDKDCAVIIEGIKALLREASTPR